MKRDLERKAERIRTAGYQTPDCHIHSFSDITDVQLPGTGQSITVLLGSWKIPAFVTVAVVVMKLLLTCLSTQC